MGGSGGKREREKRKAGTSTIGGKFSSIGDQSEQKANHALVVGKLAEVIPLIQYTSSNDRLFLQDCRIKLNQQGSGASFGWRQVEVMVRIWTEVKAKEKEAMNGKQHRTGSQSTGPAVN